MVRVVPQEKGHCGGNRGGLETVDRPAGPETSCQAIGRGTKGSLKVGSLPDSCNE